MTDSEQIAFIRDVLTIGDGFGDLGDLWDSIHWRTDEEYAPVTFFVNCSDLFVWASSDCETLTHNNLPALLQAIADVRTAIGAVPPVQGGTGAAWSDNFSKWYDSGGLGAQLFCARQRKLRPQRPCYDTFPKELWPLFDAC